MASQYIVTDRTTAQNYALKVDDEQLYFEATADTASDEPIFEDDINAGTYYQLFIDDAELAIISVSTPRDDIVYVLDPTLNKAYRVVVLDGQLAIVEYTVPGKGYKVTRFVITPLTVRVTPTNRIAKFQQSVRVTKSNIKRAVVNAKIQVLKLFGLGGAGTAGTVALASADTWYQVPQSGSVPKSDYTLVVTKENEDGTIRWAFKNTSVPSATYGNKSPTHLSVDLKADQFIYCGSDNAGDDVCWTAKIK